MRRIAADAVVIKNNKVLLIERTTEPYKGMLAMPGGQLEDGETLEQCVMREVKEETGLEVKPSRLVGVYSHPLRDPRGTVAVVYICKVSGGSERPGFDTSKVVWLPLRDLKRTALAFDHKKIIMNAITTIKRRDRR